MDHAHPLLCIRNNHIFLCKCKHTCKLIKTYIYIMYIDIHINTLLVHQWILSHLQRFRQHHAACTCWFFFILRVGRVVPESALLHLLLFLFFISVPVYLALHLLLLLFLSQHLSVSLYESICSVYVYSRSPSLTPIPKSDSKEERSSQKAV